MERKKHIKSSVFMLLTLSSLSLTSCDLEVNIEDNREDKTTLTQIEAAKLNLDAVNNAMKKIFVEGKVLVAENSYSYITETSKLESFGVEDESNNVSGQTKCYIGKDFAIVEATRHHEFDQSGYDDETYSSNRQFGIKDYTKVQVLKFDGYKYNYVGNETIIGKLTSIVNEPINEEYVDPEKTYPIVNELNLDEVENFYSTFESEFDYSKYKDQVQDYIFYELGGTTLSPYLDTEHYSAIEKTFEISKDKYNETIEVFNLFYEMLGNPSSVFSYDEGSYKKTTNKDDLSEDVEITINTFATSSTTKKDISEEKLTLNFIDDIEDENLDKYFSLIKEDGDYDESFQEYGDFCIDYPYVRLGGRVS